MITCWKSSTTDAHHVEPVQEFYSSGRNVTDGDGMTERVAGHPHLIVVGDQDKYRAQNSGIKLHQPKEQVPEQKLQTIQNCVQHLDYYVVIVGAKVL